MSFENGYEIRAYLGDVIDKYKEDSNVFTKCISSLNIFMQRQDWPLCYNEFETSVSELIGSPESICRNIGMFLSQDPELNPNVKDWDKDLDKNFLSDIKFFYSVVSPIINTYYDYTNNPLGINRIIQINNSGNNKLIRINRLDGLNFDLRLSDYEIKEFANTLLGMIN